MKIRLRLALAAVVLQALVLVFMAGQREWIFRTGRSILLRTAPIDPNDPMRGDYVRLDYDISRVPRHLLAGNLPKLFEKPATGGRRAPQQPVYAQLEVGADGVASLTALTDAKPAGGLFIRGRAQNSFGRLVTVRYGIEALFMQQGTARKLEDMRNRERAGVPLDMQVALGSSGIAVLKNHRWEPLGITVTFERTPLPARTSVPPVDSSNRQQFITAVNVELKNHGPEDVAIVDLPGGASFRMVPDDGWQEARYQWVGENRAAPSPTASQVVVLKPGETHRAKIDLTQTAWFVVNSTATGDKKPIALRHVTDPWSVSFRLEYAPPPKASVTAFPHAELIRHGRLRSRAFTATAGMD